MRNNGRYQEVVDYMMPLCTQLELCTCGTKPIHKASGLFLERIELLLDSRDEALSTWNPNHGCHGVRRPRVDT